MKKSFPNKLLICIPALPLLDMLIIKEFPLFSIIGYIITFIVYGTQIKTNYLVLLIYSFVFMVFCSSIIALIDGNPDIIIFYYLLGLLVFSAVGIVIGQNINSFFSILKKMTYFYAFLNTLIYASRMIMYSFDFARVRGNVAIYGGNSAHFILLAFLLLLKNQRSTEYRYFLYYTFIHSIMFLSKGAILITIIWIIIDIISTKKSKILNKQFIALGFILFIVIYNLIDTTFGEYLILRFENWFSSIQNNEAILGSRAEIFDFTASYILQNTYVLLFGVGPTAFRNLNPWGYSNTHNLLADILIDTGIFSLVIFLGIVSYTFIKSENRIYYLLCIIYAILEGVALFYISDVIFTGYMYMFIIILFLGSSRRNVKSATSKS